MPLSRKEFIKGSALLAGAAFTGLAFEQTRKPLLSFSTLGCPDWTFKQIVDFAAANNYGALEIRGIQREMNLARSPDFSSPERIKASLALMKEKGLRFINLGTSATMHHPEGAEREKAMVEAKTNIDLAQQLNCPYIRVFPDRLPKEFDKNVTLALISKGLFALGDYAKQRNVTVLMETHGDLVKSDDLLTVMRAAEHPNVGLVWDAVNMWTVTKEPPAQMYSKLKKYIRHTHIKDAKLTDKEPIYVLIGKGDAPIHDVVNMLKKDRYPGYYSFEWEKLWHPELAGPEIALADYPKVMMGWLK
jgi:sugar phosphate isomerase/epimerase